jgi:hypothetical protein
MGRRHRRARAWTDNAEPREPAVDLADGMAGRTAAARLHPHARAAPATGNRPAGCGQTGPGAAPRQLRADQESRKVSSRA